MAEDSSSQTPCGAGRPSASLIAAMDTRQLQYLEALGVDVWRRRDALQDIVRTPASSDLPPGPAALPAGTVARDSGPAATAVDTLDWSALASVVSTCVRCPLSASRTQTVFGVGDTSAEWMVIGEAPGADEDRQGEPFVGRAGQLLTSMLRAIGLKREQVYIANILKCRPPGNRDPQPAEVDCCMPYLARQIELVNPRLILCVGRIAAQNLLRTETPIGKLRGAVHAHPGSGRPVVVTYHPAYLLRSPAEKRKAWADLTLALATANGVAPSLP